LITFNDLFALISLEIIIEEDIPRKLLLKSIY